MTTPGKNYPGEKGFPTPDEITVNDGYLVFKFPKDNQYTGLLLAAASLLSRAYNWYKWGDMLPEDAAYQWEQIVNDAPFNSIVCSLPGGQRIIRLDGNGHIQELGDDGEWQDPTGDYEIPPVTPREGGTPEDQKCLAAANAVNVLEQLYEQVVDGIQDGLSILELIALILAGIAALIAGAIGLAAASLIAILLIAFREFIAAATYLGADVWDEDFSEKLQCMLYLCAVDDDGVITFDYQCFVDQLYANTSLFDFTGAQLRLLGQIGYLLNIIGADGLNLAGATTAITSATCDCAADHCHYFDFLVEDGGFEPPYPGAPAYASTWVSGTGWVPFHSGVDGLNGLQLTFSEPLLINSATAHWTGSGGGSSPFDGISMQFWLAGTLVATVTNNNTQIDGCMIDATGGFVADQVALGGNTIWASGTFAFTGLAIAYRAESLVLGDDNCDEEPDCP